MTKLIVFFYGILALNLACAQNKSDLNNILDDIDQKPKASTLTPPAETKPPTPVVTSTPITKPQPTSKVALEETSLVVFRTLEIHALDGSTEVIRIPVPVYYRTKSIAFSPDQVQQAQALKQRLDAYIAKLEALKAESNQILQDYQTLMQNGVPQDALAPDSPTLPDSSSNGNNSTLKNSDISIKIKNQ